MTSTPYDRRRVLTAGAAVATLGATTAGALAAGPRDVAALALSPSTALLPDADHGQSRVLQAAIDAHAARGAPLVLPAGQFKVADIVLQPGTRLIGSYGATTLSFAGGATFLTARDADDIVLQDITLDGGGLALDPARADALVAFQDCARVALRGVDIRRSLLNGLSLTRCAGRVTDCTITLCSLAAIRSIDASGLDILHNAIADCGNNGIQIWRETAGEDGTLVANNRIRAIAAKSGGTGENGNGINVFRAGSVLVSGNRITDCAYTAVRGNTASNIQILSNSCARLGEVAIYAEFAFEGALIANNLIDKAATGISVTNFNDGGRLAIVQGNLIRNLFRREHEVEDKRGEGIGIEADSVVSGNVIENAPTCGIKVGWGRFLRDCVVSQNLIRASGVGILVSDDAAAGVCRLSGNMISGCDGGAIRRMEYGRPIGPDLAAPSGEGASKLMIDGKVVG